MIQEFALLGFHKFKNIIKFMQNILKVGWLNYKKYYNECKKVKNLCKKAVKRGGRTTNHASKNGVSKWTFLRHIKDINKNMKKHAEDLNIDVDTMKHKWVNYEYTKNSSFFENNNKLAKHKQYEFDKLQQKLWSEYHKNPDRIKNLTLNIVNRRQSYRDFEESRVSVCLCISLSIFVLSSYNGIYDC